MRIIDSMGVHAFGGEKRDCRTPAAQRLSRLRIDQYCLAAQQTSAEQDHFYCVCGSEQFSSGQVIRDNGKRTDRIFHQRTCNFQYGGATVKKYGAARFNQRTTYRGNASLGGNGHLSAFRRGSEGLVKLSGSAPVRTGDSFRWSERRPTRRR